MTGHELLDALSDNRDKLLMRFHHAFLGIGYVDYPVEKPLGRMRMSMRDRVTRAEASIQIGLWEGCEGDWA